MSARAQTPPQHAWSPAVAQTTDLDAAKAVGIQFAGLAVAGKSIRLEAQNIGVFYAGTVNPLDSSKVQADFILRNDGKTPLELDNLKPSCHCTTAVVQCTENFRTGEDGLPILAPGQQVTVRVTVDLTGQPAGSLVKTVTVYAGDALPPAAQLLVRADVAPIVSFSPLFLDFGEVNAGTSKSLPVTLSVDSRLVDSGTFPGVIATSQNVQVIPAPLTISRSAFGGRGTHMVTRSYQVTVSKDAALGPISGILTIFPSAKDTAEQRAALASTSVLLGGHITGSLNTSPAMLAFGTVPYGHEAVRPIILTSLQRVAAGDIKVGSQSPWISVHVAEDSGVHGPASQQSGTSHVLLVTLSSQAPAGKLETHVKVSMSNGQRLLIPISANVSASSLP